MRASHLQRSLDNLAAAMREVEKDLAELRAMHDPLALHIFQSRRHYRTMSDTKSGKRHALAARLSWRTPATTATAAPSPNGPGCCAIFLVLLVPKVSLGMRLSWKLCFDCRAPREVAAGL